MRLDHLVHRSGELLILLFRLARLQSQSLLLKAVLLVLDLPPIRCLGLVAACLPHAACESGLAGVELVSFTTVGRLAIRDWHVSAEAFAHVDHATLAFAEPLLELTALERQGVDEGFAEAVGGGVALDHDAFGLLETLRERIACVDTQSVDGPFDSVPKPGLSGIPGTSPGGSTYVVPCKS